MIHARRLALFSILVVVAPFAACTLNPQPLPPLDPPEENKAAGDPSSGFGSIDGGLPADPQAEAPSDASTNHPPDAGQPYQTVDAGDGGQDGGDTDGGDGGGASNDGG